MPTIGKPQCWLLGALFGVLPASGSAAQSAGVRDVTPPGVLRVYRSNETMEQASDLRQLPSVQVLNDGTLRAGGKVYQLYGLSFPARKKICIAPSGERWACGQRAYIMLRSQLQGRTMNCRLRSGSEEAGVPLLTGCRVNDIDIALSLLRSGLVDLAEGVTDRDYIEAAAQGKATVRRGTRAF